MDNSLDESSQESQSENDGDDDKFTSDLNRLKNINKKVCLMDLISYININKTKVNQVILY